MVLTGEQSFVLTGSSDVTLSGFAFRQSTTLEIPADCRRIRLTRNDFQLADIEGLHWLMVRADHSTVDHNAFHGKTTLGIYLGIEGAGTDQMAAGVHVFRNHFSDHTFPGDNGGEPIRLGVSPRALSTAGAIVEFNLFERANGDPEAISVKSSGNVIRHNTIRDSLGGIVLRHGNANRVEGNFILSGSNGIRIYGDDHRIVSNYVERIGGSGMVLGSGNVRDHFPGEDPGVPPGQRRPGSRPAGPQHRARLRYGDQRRESPHAAAARLQDRRQPVRRGQRPVGEHAVPGRHQLVGQPPLGSGDRRQRAGHKLQTPRPQAGCRARRRTPVDA